MKRAAGLALILVLCACSKVENGLTPPSGGAIPGVVRIVGIGSMNSLIPELAGTAAAEDIAQFWGAWLFLVDDKGDLVPELATEIPTLGNGGISRDGLTITYHLRRGVTWHDGAPFDARDVIFSWHAIMNPANNVLSRTGYDQVVAMSAPDPYTVKVTLRHPYAPVVSALFGPSLTPMSILPAHLLQNLPNINRAPYDSLPVGTGPFIITDYEPQSRVILKPNPHYWRGPPKLREIDVIMVPDDNTRVVMMRTGEADLFYDPPANVINQLKSIRGVHVDDVTFNEFWYLNFNVEHPPLDDVRVRHAIEYAVDRDRFIHNVLGGYGAPARSDQPPFFWSYDSDIPLTPYDPQIAATLLDSAGWTLHPDGFRYRDGKRISLVYLSSTGYGDAVRYGPIFQADMKKIGVDVQLKFVPSSMLFAAKSDGGLMENGRFDVSYQGWIGGVDPDDATLWMCGQAPPVGWNLSFYCDPKLDAAENAALTTYDQAARTRAYFTVQQVLAQDAPADFLFWEKRDDAVRDGFLNYRPAPAVTEFWNSWQWQMR
ncbi:MAG TPA: peptide ABC transporter substrate-binding protein [Candidatus Eremiobacteraceae bacterium]|nr:peptide ABC transporter substrate-binding protein [Candidatus Eremiobacteraceae bacterium]